MASLISSSIQFASNMLGFKEENPPKPTLAPSTKPKELGPRSPLGMDIDTCSISSVSSSANTTANNSPIHAANTSFDSAEPDIGYFDSKIPVVKSLMTQMVLNTSDAADLIRLWGLPVEIHNVQLPDGFSLTIHRIPSRRGYSGPANRPVVVWHGIGLCSNVWVCSPDSRETNLGVVLADAGFDVWLANSRGSHYTTASSSSSSKQGGASGSLYTSYGCTGQSPMKEDKPRWDYSLDDLIHVDFPTTVDYILKKTGADKVRYIGYSQGTTTSFGALAVLDDMNDKVSVVVAMAPVLRPQLLSPVGRAIVQVMGGPWSLFSLFGTSEFMGGGAFVKTLFPPTMFGYMMDTTLATALDCDVSNLGTPQRKTAIYKHLHSGFSTKNVVHWFHLMCGDGALWHYHIDPDASNWSMLNVARATTHRRSLPVKYPTKHIRTPIHLYVGTEDPISDILGLTKHLPSHTSLTVVQSYTHMDFVWGMDAKERVWDDMVDVLRAN